MPDDLPPVSLDDAFQAGRTARAQGAHRDANPHPLPVEHTPTGWNAWRAGWCAENDIRRLPKAPTTQTGN